MPRDIDRYLEALPKNTEWYSVLWRLIYLSVPVDGLMETFKYFPSVVGSSVSTTIIYHRRKTFQVIGIHIEEGVGGGRKILQEGMQNL